MTPVLEGKGLTRSFGNARALSDCDFDINPGEVVDLVGDNGADLEWSRLMLHLHAGLAKEAPDWLTEAAVELFHRAATDGWAVDGAPGFVYSTDWSGRPVVRQRMHWVVAEAVAAASALHRRTGDHHYTDLANIWWDYVRRYLLDTVHGSWHHELDPENRPAATVWPGKPDLYHAVQATLTPRLPLAPGLARSLQAKPV